MYRGTAGECTLQASLPAFLLQWSSTIPQIPTIIGTIRHPLTGPWGVLGSPRPETKARFFVRPDRHITAHHVVTQKFNKVQLRRLLGSWMPSKLWLKLLPNVRLCRLLGSWMPSKLWLKLLPNVKLCRLLGSRMPCKLWLNPSPNVKLCKLLGSWMPFKLWLNLLPNVKLCRLLGSWMPSKL